MRQDNNRSLSYRSFTHEGESQLVSRKKNMVKKTRELRAVLALMLALLGGMMLAAPVNAAGAISVNTVNDEDNTGDSCSLREAIKAANTDAAYGGCTAGSGTDTITLPVGTYTLSLGDQLPPVTSAIVVEGNESIIQAHVDPETASWRVFEVVNGGDLTLEDLTVRHGYCVNALSCASQDNPDDDKGNGGGIFNGGILTLDNVDITMNTAANGGGGIYHKRGDLTVLAGSSSSNFQENSAGTDGGGIGSGGSGAISVTQAMFMSNTAGNAGGAIASNSSALDVTGSIFSSNSAGMGMRQRRRRQRQRRDTHRDEYLPRQFGQPRWWAVQRRWDHFLRCEQHLLQQQCEQRWRRNLQLRQSGCDQQHAYGQHGHNPRGRILQRPLSA